MFGSKPRELPRMLIGSRRAGDDELLGDLVAAAGRKARSGFPTAATGQEVDTRGAIPLQGGGFLQLSSVNANSEIVKRLFNNELVDGWILMFKDVPKKSPIDDARARSFYAEVAEECNVVLNSAASAGKLRGLAPGDQPIVLSII